MDTNIERFSETPADTADATAKIRQSRTSRLLDSLNSFLNGTLEKLFGAEKADEIQSQVRNAVEEKNPFKPMQLATADELVLAVQDESPATIARALSELEPKKAGSERSTRSKIFVSLEIKECRIKLSWPAIFIVICSANNSFPEISAIWGSSGNLSLGVCPF